MQKAITILEKRQNSETKSNDQFDNYGKYIGFQLRGMPERDRECVQFKIQEIIYQVKSLIPNSQPPFSWQPTCKIFNF